MTIKIEDIRDHIIRNVEAALAEDIGSGDITAKLIPADKVDTAEIITREPCTFCGKAWADEVFAQLDPGVELTWHAKDGDQLKANQKLATLRGTTRSLITGERTALNFLQLLCGTATKARRYADAFKSSHIKILDTRKTIPGLRMAQKYAVSVGGCHNHRIGLYDAYLIKENHIAACGGIATATNLARNIRPDMTIEVEVENIDELKEALHAKVEIIMLDNFSTDQRNDAQKMEKNTTKYEISGNLNLEDIAEPHASHANIDYISIGALTKHTQAIDLSFQII